MFSKRLFASIVVVIVAHCLGSVRSAEARVIHVVIAANTNDDRIGTSAAASAKLLASCFNACVSKDRLSITTVTGSSFNRFGIIRAIRQVNPTSSDGLVFIGMCHGGHDSGGHFLEMPSGTRLHRTTIVETVRRQGAGNDVVITDSCNTAVPDRSFWEPFALEPGPSRRHIAPLFESLFLDARGLLDMNSSSSGQVSFFASDGSFFAQMLFSELLENAGRRLSWTSFVSNLNADFREKYGSSGVAYTSGGVSRVQYGQQVQVWHYPPGWPGRGGDRDLGGALGNYRPEVGDIIVEVNGQPIRTRQDCINAVNRSPEIMEFVTRGKRTGNLFTYRTRLRPQGIRFGVDLADTGRNGARITSLSRGYPCTQCQWIR